MLMCARSIQGFLIGALLMMEAPYLFDDIVNGCVAVVESLKGTDHDTLLDPNTSVHHLDSKAMDVDGMGKENSDSSQSHSQTLTRYPTSVEMLKVQSSHSHLSTFERALPLFTISLTIF